MSLQSFLSQYRWILLFYAAIVLVIFIFRKKFDFQAKFIAMYRTSFGITFMERIASRYGNFLKIVGYSAIGIGFIGMIFILVTLVKNLFDLLTVPNAVSGVSLVLPGVHIPGSPIFIPFWFGIIALFCVVLFHEFGHGIIALSHGHKIKNTGIVFFGPLIGAFVEPDEEKLKKEKDVVQYSVFAAGPFFNVILAALVIFIVMFAVNPLLGYLTEPIGFSVGEITPGMPADAAGIRPGAIIDSINGNRITTFEEFSEYLGVMRPNETVLLGAGGNNYTALLAPHPENPKKGYLGITGLKNEFDFVTRSIFSRYLVYALLWLQELFKWIYLLSLGIGLANLLPLGPVDGGRMLQTALASSMNDKDKATRMWMKASVVALCLLLLNVFFPLLRYIFNKIVAI